MFWRRSWSAHCSSLWFVGSCALLVGVVALYPGHRSLLSTNDLRAMAMIALSVGFGFLGSLSAMLSCK